MSDLVRKADVLPIFCMRCVRVIDCVNDVTGQFKNNCPIKKEVDEIPSAEPMESHHRYEQGIIEGRVRMRTEMLKAIKNIVGDEVWNGI